MTKLPAWLVTANLDVTGSQAGTLTILSLPPDEHPSRIQPAPGWEQWRPARRRQLR